MKDTLITTNLLEKLGFECINENADSYDWLLHELRLDPRIYILSHFEKGQDGRIYLFYCNSRVVDSFSTLNYLIRLLEIEFNVGNLSKEAFLEIQKKIENL